MLLHFGNGVAGVLRVNLNQVARLAPVSGRGGGIVCFSSGQAAPSQHDRPEKMDKKNRGEEQQNDPAKTQEGDVMTHSFGEGYSTRSEEEGFGGTYGGNPSEITHPEYDKSQGSEVKEKEKGRNQPHSG